LTGIHLGCYGKDLGLNLADVLEALLQIEGEFRIRLGSVEPTDFDERLMAIAHHSKICQYFHIPLQSGCNTILQRMNRGYNLAFFKELTGRLRSGNPLVGIGTDLIVGFPGETEENFRETVDFLEEQAFSRIHVFRYSPRKGTPAASMVGRIPKSVQEERSHEVIRLAMQTGLRYASRFLDRTVEVLFEEAENCIWTGLSGEYLTVQVKSDRHLRNQVYPVKIIGIAEEHLIGAL
jgi:threonylcarbamoyladenosine tRNA methylthiotransferase MtaB